jgi:hypothetical protein
MASDSFVCRGQTFAFSCSEKDDAKIPKHQVPRRRDKYVLWFYVSVDSALLVNFDYAFYQLFERFECSHRIRSIEIQVSS